MDQFLEKFFDSVPRARILRLFMQNPYDLFSLEAVAKRTQIKKSPCRKEIDKLEKLKIVLCKVTTLKQQKGKKVKIKKTEAFGANPAFEFFTEVRELVSHSSVASKNKLLKQIRGLGGIKLAIISGVFLNQENARVDLLLVGDNVAKGKLNRFLAHLESELGRSVQYTLMETDEFKYRLGMYDRFLRDILEYPHKKLINRLGI